MMGAKPSTLPSTTAITSQASLPSTQLSSFPQEAPTAPSSMASYSAVPFPIPCSPSTANAKNAFVNPPAPGLTLQVQPTQTASKHQQKTSAFVDGGGDEMNNRYRSHETVLTLYPFNKNQVGDGSLAIVVARPINLCLVKSSGLSASFYFRVCLLRGEQKTSLLANMTASWKCQSRVPFTSAE